MAEWWKNESCVCQRAWSEINMWSAGRGVSTAVLALIAQQILGMRGNHDTMLMVLIAVGVGAVVFLLEFLFRLLRVPALITKEWQAKLRAEETAHTTSKTTLGSDKASLAEQLRAALDNKNERAKQEAELIIKKNILAECLVNLQNRLDVVKAFNVNSYDAVKDKEWKESTGTVDSTLGILEGKVGRDTAAYFKSSKPEPPIEQGKYNFLEMNQYDLRCHSNYLEAHIKSLRMIIEKQI